MAVASPPLPPRIETDRMVLRPWEQGDAGALHAALVESVDHLARWIPWATPHSPSPDEARALLEGWVEQREAGENLIYAAFDGASGRLLGGFGLYARVGPGALEIGYWLRRTASGLGYATEASRALGEAAFAVPGVERIEIHTDPENAASMRIPEKLGYRRSAPGPDGTGEGNGDRGTVLFVLERS